MDEIREIELQSSSEYLTALYITDNGTCLDIVFCRHIERNLGWESIELVNVQHRCGDDVEDDLLWKEIDRCLNQALDCQRQGIPTFRFIIEIGVDYLGLLESLEKLVLADSVSTPEAALEATIFRQIADQAKRSRLF